MTIPKVNIHTHRPTGEGIELRTAGIHPWQVEGRSATELEPLAAEVQAIGEIGLDALRGPSREEQLRLLHEQLSMAEHSALPVVVHCVRTFEPLMQALECYRLRAVIFHGFIGSSDQAQRAVARGYYLSFGERSLASHRTVKALRTVPIDRIFCETDESDTPIDAIYERTATAIGIGVEELSGILWQNYKRIFDHNDDI